jgi:hypothetical protein
VAVIGLAACTATEGKFASSSTTVEHPSTSETSPVPNAQPDASGVFHLPQPPAEPEGPWLEISEETDPYYRHALLDMSGAVVVGSDGTTIPADAVEAGSEVEVWIGGCHERYPVECDVTTMRVVEAP